MDVNTQFTINHIENYTQSLLVEWLTRWDHYSHHKVTFDTVLTTSDIEEVLQTVDSIGVPNTVRPSIRVLDNGSLIADFNMTLVYIEYSSQYDYYHDEKPYEEGDIRECHISVWSVNEDAKEIANNVLQLLTSPDNPPVLQWFYKTDGRMTSDNVRIKHPKPIVDEFYPWLGDVTKFMDNYVASESPILVLLGPPGTGKTNLINNLIWRAHLKTTFTYEESLLETDGLFAQFITGRQQLLIMEDADTLLSSREHDANRVMNKFLNIGDGLIEMKKKKIIFTANIRTKDNIDEALIRPGRCFSCQTFRELGYSEVLTACEAANILPPLENRSYTLAEVFANNRGERLASKRKVGF